MGRSPLSVLVVAVVAFIGLGTLNVLHRLGPPVLDLWQDAPHFDILSGQELAQDVGDEYLVGVGKADITGPVVEIDLMGYADPAQLGTGLRQRLYSRAFIIGNVDQAKDRLVYLVLDTQSGDTAVRHGILDAIKALGDDYAVYGQNNIAVTGTHSHSGPGGWLNYLLPQITTKGFDKPSYQAIVQGAVASIKQAHESLAPGHLSVGSIDVKDANVNRSPWAYLQNPADERERYSDDVDKAMTVLRVSQTSDEGEKDVGILTWFPVHGTSMLGNNTLVTGDNKGVAAILFEKAMNDTSFVAGFSQANVGDTSPNINGAYCESGPQAGQQCDFKTSLCDNKTQPCHARGPYWGRNDAGTASNFEIGNRQADAARALYNDPSAFIPVTGNVVKSVHQFVDLSTYHFALPNGTNVHTCPAALGYSFAGGTTDGPGAFDFKQGDSGDPDANPLWAVVSDALHKPNETQEACQGEKPILLDVGETKTPYDWSPNIVDIQLFRVGQLFMIISPGEATTMSGRRWKEALASLALSTFSDIDSDDHKPVVVLGGPANSYTHYIATPEEYSVQRYEGASTLYGPWTLYAYINLTLTYLPRLAASTTGLPDLGQGPLPPINVNRSLNFITPVIVDSAPIFKGFGDVLSDVNPTPYHAGDTILARFVGANPRNNFRLGETFAAVERENPDTSTWEQVRSDEDWSLVYEWKRTSTILGQSEVTIKWETKWETGAWREEDQDAESIKEKAAHGELLVRDSNPLTGKYRLKYYGDSKALGGKITAFKGTSGEFTIE